MKPSSIRSLLLVSALFMPHARGQDAEAKIRDIEQTVLLKHYEDSVQALAAPAGGPSGANPDAIGKQLLWLAKVDSELDADSKAAAKENTSETAGTLNDMAWSMVTAPEAAGRRPETALKLATLALELGAGDKELLPKALDTKARALFLLGRQGDAIAEQEKAVAASDAVPEEKAGFEATLAVYRKNELPEVPATARVRARFNITEDAVAANDLRKMMDHIFALQSMAGKAAKDTSGFAKTDLDQVTRELKERMDELSRLTELEEKKREASDGVPYILEKLRRIVIPVIDFENTSVEEAVDFLRKQAAALDTAEPDPACKGVNFVIRRPRAMKNSAPASGEGQPPALPEPGAIRLKELHLRNVPIAVALKYICDLSRLRYKVDDFAVTLVPQNEAEDIFTRSFRVPSDFGSSLVSIQDLLKMCGIKFGEGTSAVLSDSGVLLVTNTPTELDKVEQLIPIAIGNSERGRREASGRAFPAPSVSFGPAQVHRGVAFQFNRKGEVEEMAFQSSADQPVKRLTDEKCQISAQVEGTSESGILSGQRGESQGPPMLRLRFLSKDTEVKKGQRVFSTGRGGSVPAGLLLGTIESVEKGTRDTEAVVRPVTDSVEIVETNESENPPAPAGAQGAAALMEKLKRIVIPSINFENTSLEEAVDFLRTQAVTLDVNEPDPARKGVNFVIWRPAAKSSPAPDNNPPPTTQPEAIRVKELRLRNVPLAEALKYICQSVRLRYKVDDFCVTLMPVDAPQELFSRVFQVPQEFSSMLAGPGDDTARQDPFSKASGPKAPLTLIDLLKANGINFPDGSTVTLNASGQLLVVNTPAELSKIEQLVEAVSPPSEPAAR